MMYPRGSASNTMTYPSGRAYIMRVVFIAVTLALLDAPRGAAGLALSHWDLESANETCDGKSTCQTPPQPKNSRLTLDWQDRNCLCDQLCASYGDCCVDSPYFISSVEQRRGAANFECVDLRQFGGIYMVWSCPPDWENVGVREKCEEKQEQIDSDPVSTLPVTSHSTGLTYRNAFCAMCHLDFNQDTSVLWAPRLECPNLLFNGNLTQATVNEKLMYHSELHTWGLNLTIHNARVTRSRRDLVKSNFRARNMKNVKPATEFKESSSDELNGHSRPAGIAALGNPQHTFYSCHVDPVLPETVTHVVRRCQPDIIRSCAINWTNIEIRNRCEAYTSTVYQGSVAYRNPHCALCNNVPIQHLSCTKTASHRSNFNKDFSPAAFSILFDFNARGGRLEVGKKKMCPEKKLYDPFFKVCRNVFDAEDMGKHDSIQIELQEETSTENGLLIHFYNSSDSDQVQNYNYSNAFLTCKKVILGPEDFSLEDNNETIYIEQYKKKYDTTDFRILENGLLEICADYAVEYMDKFGVYMGYITFIGLGVSIAFLILHLLAFAFVKDLRNLSGRNLASFCLSLLCGYLGFLIGQLPVELESCQFLGFFTYYAFLASFFWMLTISFDIFRTLRLATCELRVSLGSQTKKFIIYSIFAWGIPLVIVCTAITLEYTDSPFKPGFGISSCWFSNKDGLLLLFVGPIAAIMTLNIIFFSVSAHMIYTTRHSTLSRAVSSTTSRTRRDFKLYIRLSLVMGLTWIVGLIAGFLDVQVLWYFFIGLNTLQGLFIFLAFTCNDKVVRGVGHVLRPSRKGNGGVMGNKRGPPSFSWSGVSSLTPHSEDTRKSEISNPDTLY